MQTDIKKRHKKFSAKQMRGLRNIFVYILKKVGRIDTGR